jgi:uncharacterized membrane protein YhaH (DUF805 family)
MTMDSSTQSQGIDWARLFFSFEGRTRRTHFWIAWLILFFGGMVLGMIPLVNMLCIALIWPHLAIGVKRLHDMGKPGWMIAIPYVLGVLAWIVAIFTVGAGAIMNAAALDAEDPTAILTTFGPAAMVLLASVFVSIAFWLWLGLGGSQRGDNKYGPNPKGEA